MNRLERALVLLFFFASGASGLVYEVLWVRQFGVLFGSTVYSAALVTGLYMCGLGLGSWLAGRYADRRHALDPSAPLRAYAAFELAIAALAAAMLLALPAVADLSLAVSSYQVGARGWYELAPGASWVRYGCAAALLLPVTLLMGGTLTLLIRHCVRDEIAHAGWQVGLVYGVNTAGAALGCLLTDTLLVPQLGIRSTQGLAVGLNVFAGLGALVLSRTPRLPPAAAPDAAPRPPAARRDAALAWITTATALGGFAAMAMQIVWFRYLCMLFGGYRPVFSILLTTILVGIWLGALAGGWLARRQRHAELAYALALAGFAAVAFLALVLGGPGFEARHLAYADAEHAPWPFYAVIAKGTAWRALLPALLSGASFPLANAVVQRTSESVGERAGFLYLGNTLGGVLGSLLGGFVLLPRFGMQGTAAFVAAAGLLAVVAVALGSRPLERPRGLVLGGAFAAALATLAAWLTLPANELLFRALPPELVSRDSHILALHEGRNETIAVVEAEGPSLTLVTNGHYMSTTDFSSQRYMRAFVHVPLLLADGVERVMVMCYGVGNTVDAALLHRGVRSVDVVDLSRDVLEHARYFASANGDPLADPRVHVYVNDARHHLRMQAGETYDLITGEPPPIAYAGVVNLYSREFFELAESRLRPHGMLTYWLPLNQVGEQVARSIVRAFLDVFPGAVLLSGHGHQLILVGRKGGTLALDPERVRQALARDPELRRELRWLSLDRPAEWAGLLAGTPETLRRATRAVEPLRDDRPSLEYGTRSMRRDRRVPRDLFSLADLETWCPSCRSGALSSDERSELEGYVALMATYHRSAAFLEHQPGQTRAFEIERTPDVERAIAASVYLQLWLRRLPPAYYNALHLARHGLRNEAVAGLKAMLAHDPGDARARLELADLYLALGEAEQSRAELERLLRDHPDDARALALLASLDGATRSPVR